MSLLNFSCLRNASGDSVTDIGWIVDHPDDPDFDNVGNGYAIAVIVSLYFVIGVPWNVFAICMIVRKKLYSDPTIMLLLNLTITNLLLGLLVMPFNIISGFSGEFIFGSSDAARCHVCQMTGEVFLILPSVSVQTLFLISVDRFLYLKKPLRYSSIVTPKRTLIAIFIVWVIATVIALPPLFGFGEIKFSYSIANCAPFFPGETEIAPNYIYVTWHFIVNSIPVVASIVMYACVIYIARKGIVAKLRRTNFSTPAIVQENMNTNDVERQLRSAQLQLVKLFVAILSANVITYLPTIALGFLVVITGNIHSATITVSNLSVLSQTVIHPILQAFLIRDLREIMSRFLKPWRKCFTR